MPNDEETTEQMPQVSDGELMMVNTLVIKPESRDQYVAALQEVLPQARGLSACLSLEVGEVDGQPGTFVLSEHWVSGSQYLNEILALDFYQRYLEVTESMYAAPRTVVVLHPLSSR